MLLLIGCFVIFFVVVISAHFKGEATNELIALFAMFYFINQIRIEKKRK